MSVWPVGPLALPGAARRRSGGDAGTAVGLLALPGVPREEVGETPARPVGSLTLAGAAPGSRFSTVGVAGWGEKKR